MCDVVEIGRSTDHLAASVRVPEKHNSLCSSTFGPHGQNWQKHKVFDKTSMFKTVFVCMLCLRKSLRCVSVNVSVTTIGELCDGVLAD